MEEILNRNPANIGEGVRLIKKAGLVNEILCPFFWSRDKKILDLWLPGVGFKTIKKTSSSNLIKKEKRLNKQIVLTQCWFQYQVNRRTKLYFLFHIKVYQNVLIFV